MWGEKWREEGGWAGEGAGEGMKVLLVSYLLDWVKRNLFSPQGFPKDCWNPIRKDFKKPLGSRQRREWGKVTLSLM